MLFHELAQFFEHIEGVTARTEMTTRLADLLQRATAKQAREICYFCLGTLNPPYIRTNFAIAQKTMAKILAHLFDRAESTVTHGIKEAGDSGAYFALHATEHVSSRLTVHQVYERLQELESINGSGSQEQKQEFLEQLLKECSAVEGKFIIRIVLGQLRLGFSDMTLLDAISVAVTGDKKSKKIIEHAYNLCADLGAVAELAHGQGITGIQKLGVQVGIPIRLAAAERLNTAQDIVDKLGECVAEPKLDGFRLQIHLGRDEHHKPFVRFFSRNLVDMSESFPDLVDAIAQLPCTSIICEGEAIAYNPNTGDFVPFQETVKRKRKHDIEAIAADLPLRVFLFDLLYLDGQLLLEKPLHERRALLRDALKNQPEDAALTLIEEVKIHDGPTLHKYFLEQIEKGLEGVVVKRSDAPYEPGKRGFNWIKLKRHETGELDDTLDCVIFGYYKGRGKRAKFGIGAFLVGVYNSSTDYFETIAKIGTGLSDDEWRQLRIYMDERAIDHKPALVSCDPGLYPDVWVQPERVIMVRADEITRSPIHTAGKDEEGIGYALRFPRYMGDRPDKKASEATTVHEILELFKLQKSHNHTVG